MRTLIKSVAFVRAVMLVMLICGVIFRQIGRPMLYEIPIGYKGWVVIQYENASCPSLPVRGIRLVVSVPGSGRVCTSTTAPQGYSHVRFEYLSPGGSRRSLSLGSGSNPNGEAWLLSYSPDDKSEIDFIGSKAEMENSGSPPYQVHPCPQPTWK
jgi:hypothetical protein